MEDKSLEELQRQMDEHGIDVVDDNEMGEYLNRGENAPVEPTVTPFRFGPEDEDYRDPRDFAYDPTLEEDLGYEYGGSTGTGEQDDNPPVNDGTGDNETADDNNSGTEEENEREEIEGRIARFEAETTKIKEHLEQIKGSLVLGTEEDLAIGAIRQLDSEVRVLDEFSQELISRIDNFRDKYANADFSVGYKEITAELQSIKNDLRTVKQLQIENYNYTVDATNQVIESLRSYDNPEINAVLDSLPTLSRCNANITRWDARMDYLDSIDYNALIEVNRRLAELQNKQLDGPGSDGGEVEPQDTTDGTDETSDQATEDEPTDENERDPENPGEDSGTDSGDEEEPTEENDLSDDTTWTMTMWELHNRMDDIEKRIADIKAGIVDDMTLEDVNRLRSDLTKLSNTLIDFNARLDVYKNEIGEEAYNELFERYELAFDDLYDLNKTLDEKGTELAEANGKVFNDLKKRLELLSHEKDYLKLSVNSLFSKTNKATVEELLKHVSNLINRLGEIEKDAKEALDAGKIDNNQYDQLMKNIETLKPELEEINDKLKDPGMFKDADIYSVLNGDIDGIEQAIEMLDADVESREKPIKRPERKELDKKFKAIEKEINRLEKTLKQYKDKDPEKYNATMDRLKAAKEKLEKVGKKYRSRCPLLVRAVKSAKALFKKYKKQILIAAGIIAFALVAHHVLIPAIMHGNEMIALTSPLLKDFANFSNNVLGGVINAKRTTEGFWFLANGVRINPLSSASSLLKGLAVSGIGSAALIGPQVVAIKKLLEKMKLKERLKEGKEKLDAEKNKRKEKAGKPKEKTKDSNKKADKKSLEKIKAMLLEYRKSGKTFEEFTAEKELSEEELTILKYLVESSEEYNKTYESNSSGRKGR